MVKNMGSETEAQAPPAEPVAPAEQAAPAKSGGGKGMIIAIAVIAVVAIVVIAFMFMGGGSVEGKWVFDDVEVYDEDGTLNQTASDAFDASQSDSYIEFKTDGTVEMGDSTGSDDGGTYVAEGGELTITSTYEVPHSEYNSTTGNTTWDNETVTDTMEYTYSVSGNTMTLEFEIDGKTVKVTATKE